MLTHLLKASFLSALLVQGLTADVTQHTFPDGASLSYSLTDVTSSPTPVEGVAFHLPYLNESKILGKSELSKDSSKESYTIRIDHKIDPNASIQLDASSDNSGTLIVNDKGNITLQLNENGEAVQGSNVIFTYDTKTLKAESMEYSHEYKKSNADENLFSNKVNLLFKNGITLHNIDLNDPFALQEIGNNPFSQFKEVMLNFSYLSTKDVGDYQKDQNAIFRAKGPKGFELESTLKAEIPFPKVPGAEKLEGYSFVLSVPVIDLRIEGDEDKKLLKDTLDYNVKVYETILEKYSNDIAKQILASLQKHSEEIVNRHFQYFTEFSKDDIASFLLNVKGAATKEDLTGDKLASIAELDLAIRKFIMQSNFKMLANGAYSCVVSFPSPESSIRELSHFIRTNAFLVEPILKDLGYWEAVQNGSDPDKMLNLLRQLSDDPKATGNSPLTITVKMDDKGMTVGTLNMERAAQLVVGWALMAFPLPIK